MKNVASGVISFLRYEVESVHFQINGDYDEEEVFLEFEPEAEVMVSGSEMLVKLTLNIFREAKKKGYPFEMELVLNGYFVIDNENDDINSYQANAIAILYPYARALVTTFTANSNVSPLVLPTINVNKMLSDKLIQQNKHH